MAIRCAVPSYAFERAWNDAETLGKMSMINKCDANFAYYVDNNNVIMEFEDKDAYLIFLLKWI